MLQPLEKIEPYITGVVSQQSEENRQDVLICLSFVDQRTERENILSQRLPHIGELVRLQLVQVWNDLRDEH